MKRLLPFTLTVLIIAIFAWSAYRVGTAERERTPPGRERVVFWHFWGGEERDAVREIVNRFNASQDRYHVEEVPIPGQNLDMKFFMAVSGGDHPDLINQDDQVIAGWADRGVLTPIRELCESDAEYERLRDWLSPAARRIGTANGELYGLCNALDIRLLIYREDFLNGGPVPETLAEFDALAKRSDGDSSRLPYLPDDRRLWAWGTVFGGSFFDEQTETVTANDERIVAALEWMVSYTDHYGLETIRRFRSTNREVGAASMLIEGRYRAMLDGQWRVPQLDAEIERTDGAFRYGVMPLPPPPNGAPNAGWVNGNFFLVPKGARNKAGAWAFMKFWAGFDHEAEAAVSAAAGGWIPASSKVVEQPEFQAYLDRHPNFRVFVEQATSPNQTPTPPIPIQAYFYERLNLATEEALNRTKSPREALDDANRDIQSRWDAYRKRRGN